MRYVIAQLVRKITSGGGICFSLICIFFHSSLKMNFLNIQEVTDYIASNETDIKIRRGKKSDCKEVARLIQELAYFEKMPDGPKLSYKVLEDDGFVKNPPLFHLFVAEKPEKEGEEKGTLVGYALYYNKYSSWMGKGMVLEDLYCTPDSRNKHVGAALFKAVLREAVSTGCVQVDFEVLGWNPARKFYEKFGATDLTEKENWHRYRVTKQALEALNF